MDSELIDFVAFIAEVAEAAYEGYTAHKEYYSRRWWVRELNQSRDVDGFFILNFEKMKKLDPEHFFKMTRMNSSTFDLLFVLLEEKMQKTSKRKPIEPKFRLFLTMLLVFM